MIGFLSAPLRLGFYTLKIKYGPAEANWQYPREKKSY